MMPKARGSPSIPAGPHPVKNTGDFKGNEKFVPGLKPRLRRLYLAAGMLGLRVSVVGDWDDGRVGWGDYFLRWK